MSDSKNMMDLSIQIKNNKEINSCFIEGDDSLDRWIDYISEDFSGYTYKWSDEYCVGSIETKYLVCYSVSSIELPIYVSIQVIIHDKEKIKDSILNALKRYVKEIQEKLNKYQIPDAYCIFTGSARFYINIESCGGTLNIETITPMIDEYQLEEDFQDNFDDYWEFDLLEN
jgi:hypothetical protein